MSLLSTDYNSGGNGNGNNTTSGNNSESKFEERDSLKLDKYALVSFEIARLGEYTHGQYGQSLIVDIDDVRVHHGMLYDRFYVPSHEDPDDYEDDTMKVFGFGKWFQTDENGLLAEEMDEDLINQRYSEEAGSKTFPYEFVDYIREEDPEEVSLGNMTMWLSNSSKNRTFAKVVTPQGHDIISDKDDDHNWMATEEPQLRHDLRGRRVILFFKDDSFTVEEDGEEKVIDYTTSVILDEKTKAGITIQNGGSGDESDDDEESEMSGVLGGEAQDDADSDDSGSAGVPSGLDDVIGFMARAGETNPENVEQFISDETDEDYDLDAVISAVESHPDFSA